MKHLIALLPLVLLLACSEKTVEKQLEETSVKMGDESGAFGTNVSRPKWLPKRIDLPDDLTIQIAAYDKKLGEGMVHGSVEKTSAEPIVAAQKAMLTREDYTVTEKAGREGPTLSATHTDGTFIKVSAATPPMGNTVYRLEYHAAHSDDALRAQDKANAYDGRGELVLNLAEEDFTLQGKCRIERTLVTFKSEDGSTELSASSAGTVPNVRGNVNVPGGEVPRILSVIPGSDEPGPKVELNASGFTYVGSFLDFSVMKEAKGSLMMSCARI